MRRSTLIGSNSILAFGLFLAISGCEGDGTGLMDGGDGGRGGGGGSCRENCDGGAGSGGQSGDAGSDRGSGGGGGGDLPKCGDKPPTAGSACEKPGMACGTCTDGGAAHKCVCEAGKWSCGATDSFTCPKPDGGADGGSNIPTCMTKPPSGACEKSAMCGYCTEAGAPQKCFCEGGAWKCTATDSFKCPRP